MSIFLRYDNIYIAIIYDFAIYLRYMNSIQMTIMLVRVYSLVLFILCHRLQMQREDTLKTNVVGADRMVSLSKEDTNAKSQLSNGQ